MVFFQNTGIKMRCCTLQNFIYNDYTLKLKTNIQLPIPARYREQWQFYFESEIIQNIDDEISYNLNFYISSNYFYKNFDSYPNFFEITEENNEKEEKMS